MGHVTRCLQALVGGDWPTNEWINHESLSQMADGRRDLTEYFERHDKVFMQPGPWMTIEPRYRHLRNKVVLYPYFEFHAYHPDAVYVTVNSTGCYLEGPCYHYQSSVTLLAWKAGLRSSDALRLFRRDVFRRLGFFDLWKNGCDALRAEGQRVGLPMDAMLDQWISRGCFMHTINHPKLYVMGDVITQLLRREGIATLPGNPIQYVRDFLADSVVWPVYPDIGEALGIPGSYLFKLSSPSIAPDHPVRFLDLKEFVEHSYDAYSQHSPEELSCDRLEQPAYRELIEELRTTARRSRSVAPSSTSASDAMPNRDMVAAEDVERTRIEEARQLFKPSSPFWQHTA